MNLNEAKELLEENGYIIDEGIFDSIKNKFFKKKEAEPEVKPASKKLYDDQIEKTSQQAYNHTTDSMSTLKQIATNFNGKNAGELKQLWSGLSKLLNKHGMSVKNHDYYLGITNDNTKFSVWAYIANREKDWTDIKVIGTVKANVFEYKYTTNYDLDDSSLKGQADDLNEWLTELDSIALKLFKGVSREEWEEGAHQNESVNKAIKLLESAGYILETRCPGMQRQVFKPTGGDFEDFMNDAKIQSLYNYAVKAKKKNDKELTADGNDPDDYDSLWYDIDESYYVKLGAAVNKFLGEEKIDIYTTPSPSIIVETDNDQFEFDLSAGQWDNVDLGVDRQDPDEFFKTIYKIATEK